MIDDQMIPADTTKTERVTAIFEVEVPVNDWIVYLTEDVDIFRSNYCGYWLRGIEQDEKGWLVWEDDEKCPQGEEPNVKEALQAWTNGSALPPKYFRITKEVAIKAYIEGVRRWGVDWFNHGDAEKYDVVLQMALLGEVRYG